MTPEQAIDKLKARNQAYVNKVGHTNAYSRETDEIISALLVGLQVKEDWEELLYKVDSYGRLLGIERASRFLTMVEPHVFVIVERGCTTYRRVNSVNEQVFNFTNPKVLLEQLIEATETWCSLESDRNDQVASLYQQLHYCEENEGKEGISELKKTVTELLKEYEHITDTLTY